MHLRFIFALATLVVCLSPAGARSEDAGDRQATYWASVREIYNTRITLSFDQKPLAEVAALISEQIGLPVVIDQLSLDDSGIDRSHALTGHFENLPLHEVMRLLLRPLDWACTYDPACLTLSSADEAELRLKVRVYPVGDLLNRDCLDFESLLDVTVSTVASETWAENGGGEAEIRPLVVADALIISQTAPIHLEIEELLGNIRWAMRVQKIPPGGNPCAHAERWEKHPGMGGSAAASAWVRTGGWAAEGPIDEPSPSTDEDRSQSNTPTE